MIFFLMNSSACAVPVVIMIVVFFEVFDRIDEDVVSEEISEKRTEASGSKEWKHSGWGAGDGRPFAAQVRQRSAIQQYRTQNH